MSAELACSYAALILHDEEIEITVRFLFFSFQLFDFYYYLGKLGSSIDDRIVQLNLLNMKT